MISKYTLSQRINPPKTGLLPNNWINVLVSIKIVCMGKQRKLRVGVAGARWLGVNCLSFLKEISGIEISQVCFPSKNEIAWWKDVIDEDEVGKMGFEITTWSSWRDLEFDLVFSILHGKIFKKIHLENSRFGVINLHPAPLPEYRGCNSYAHAIMNGDRQYRVSMHYVDEGIDNGPLIGQSTLQIEIDDTGYSLYQKSQISAFALFKRYAPKIIEAAKAESKFPAKAQDESRANYYKRDSIKNKEANLSWDGNKLYNFIRALDFPPFKPAYIVLNGQKIYLTLNQR